MENHEVEVSPLDPRLPGENEDYLYGIDLFNHGYFWESHVWWEAIWNEAGRKGELADFLKGLIKLAAGGVKINLAEEDVSIGHIDRALELLAPIAENHPSYAGLDMNNLLIECDRLKSGALSFKEFKLILNL